MTALRAMLGGLLLLVALQPAPAAGHALQPGYLAIAPLAGDDLRVFWRVPDVQGRPMPITVRLPEGCAPASGPAPRRDGQAWLASWVARCPGGLAGGTLAIGGLERTQTDVLVRLEMPAGAVLTERLTAERTAIAIPAEQGRLDVLRTYVPLGVEHILGGFDHLLFVLALLLLIPDRGRLVGAVTAFTVAHSLTLAVATLGWVSLSPAPVEASIALSIMFVAAELVQREAGAPRLSERWPWTVAFAFGLLHGFGFAGALVEIGLPQGEVPLALLSFNVGVELGQLGFIAAVLLAAGLARRLAPRAGRAFGAGGPGVLGLSYAIGGVSAMWFVERVVAL